MPRQERKPDASMPESNASNQTIAAQTVKDGGKPQQPKPVPSTGWASMPSTSVFRAVNFELYAKPNKFVMALGLAAFGSCIGYIIYMNVTDNKRKATYVTLDLDGSVSTRPRTSRWE